MGRAKYARRSAVPITAARTWPRLAEGMVLAIEPMVNMGTHLVETLQDNWTVVTADGKPSARYEHTVAITKDGLDFNKLFING